MGFCLFLIIKEDKTKNKTFEAKPRWMFPFLPTICLCVSELKNIVIRAFYIAIVWC